MHSIGAVFEEPGARRHEPRDAHERRDAAAGGEATRRRRRPERASARRAGPRVRLVPVGALAESGDGRGDTRHSLLVRRAAARAGRGAAAAIAVNALQRTTEARTAHRGRHCGHSVRSIFTCCPLLSFSLVTCALCYAVNYLIFNTYIANKLIIFNSIKNTVLLYIRATWCSSGWSLLESNIYALPRLSHNSTIIL